MEQKALEKPVIPRDELLRLADNVQLDEEVIEFLQEHAENFVDSVTEFACSLAKHRNSEKLESSDIQLALEQLWGLRVPCVGQDVPTLRKPTVSSSHLYRMQVIGNEQFSKGERGNKKVMKAIGKNKKNSEKVEKNNKKMDSKTMKREHVPQNDS
eukprot:jgi/Galph1/4476/GphlegSOOS_G3175.1